MQVLFTVLIVALIAAIIVLAVIYFDNKDFNNEFKKYHIKYNIINFLNGGIPTEKQMRMYFREKIKSRILEENIKFDSIERLWDFVHRCILNCGEKFNADSMTIDIWNELQKEK